MIFSFVKDATSRHRLVVHVSVDCLGTSSSSSSVRENVDMSLNIGFSSSVSNDEVIRDISYYSDLKEKSLFKSKEVLSKCFCIIEVKSNFQFRTIVSNLRSLEFRCLQEGCKWYVRASRYKKSDLWMLRKYTSDHDCSLSTA